MRLQQRVAVITGAASGIGKAIALAYARAGADIAILDIDAAKAGEVVTAIEALGRRARFIACDVGRSDQVSAAFATVIKHFGGLDILVNNTGIIRFSRLVDMAEAEWDLVLRVNLTSAFLCSQQAARQMIKQGRGGRIICLSSIHAALSLPQSGHYAATKGGMEALCRTLATELAPYKITANYLRPGATYTELTTPMYTPAVKRSLLERVPLQEIADPDWIAAGAVFLASDESRYMTGQQLTIDGGYLMDGSLPAAEYCKDGP